MAAKANIHQAEGNLEQAGKFLSQINAQTPSENALVIKMTQLRLERNYAEAFSSCKPAWLNSTLLLRPTRPLLRPSWLSRSALPGIPLAQKLQLNRRTTRWNSSAKINQTAPSLPHCCPWLIPRAARRTQP